MQIFKVHERTKSACVKSQALTPYILMDRTSCESFWANQLRVLLALSAAALWQAFQQKLPVGIFRGMQMSTLRERLIKRAVQVRESVRRVVLEFSVHYPWQAAWRQIALAVGGAGAPG